MVGRCILKDTNVFECFFNPFECIYSVFYCIGSVFECIYNVFYYINNVFECISNVFQMYLNIFMVYLNVFIIFFNVFTAFVIGILPLHSHCNVSPMRTYLRICFSLSTMTPFPICSTTTFFFHISIDPSYNL
jgi:hypothetical protein